MKMNHFGIRFEGDRFSPKTLVNLTGLPLKILSEFGEIGTKGRYKGKFSPYGMAFLDIDYELKNNNLIEIINKYTNVLLMKKSALDESRVDNIVFDIETFKSAEENYSLEGEILKKLGELNARVEIKTISEEEALEKLLSEVDFFLDQRDNKSIIETKYSKAKWLIENRIMSQGSFHFHSQINRAGDLNIQQRYFHSMHSHVGLNAFFFIYLIMYLNADEKDIPTFEKAYEEYSKDVR